MSLDNQQYFRALTEASIVSKSDIDGKITYVNDYFCKVTGYSREEIMGRSHSMFRHPENTDDLYKEMWQTIKSGSIWQGRMTNVNKDGSFFLAETTIIPLIDQNGTIVEYMAIRNDITDMVMLKRKLLEKEQKLQQHENIKEAQKSFLLLFTHELKTPLNAIINFNKYIKSKLEDTKEIDRPKLLSLLDSILKNANDMYENVTKILEVSKLKSGKMKYNREFFNLKEFVTVSLQQFKPLMSSKNIALETHMEDDLFIHSDSYRVKQIVSNIISNAIKYGHDKIEVKLFKDHEKIVLSVEDNGEGIKDKEAIFELYEQESEGLLQRKEDGTGIGLYFLKLLCDDLGIGYKVEDAKVGKGTCFVLIFLFIKGKY